MSQGDIAPNSTNNTWWTDTQNNYVHTNTVGGWGSAFIFGQTNPSGPNPTIQLFDPPFPSTLFQAIVNFVNGNGQ